MLSKPAARPFGVTALSIFIFFGAMVSFLSGVSLLFPGSLLEPMWQVNPEARQAFAVIGLWGAVLMAAVCVACAAAAFGLWRGRRWGYWLAVVGLATNLLGDAFNGLLREPKALIGLPIVAVILAYLASRGVRRFFHPVW